MENNKYWLIFEQTGKISDYLNYISHSNEEQSLKGENLIDADNHKWDCDKGKRI